MGTRCNTLLVLVRVDDIAPSIQGDVSSPIAPINTGMARGQRWTTLVCEEQRMVVGRQQPVDRPMRCESPGPGAGAYAFIRTRDSENTWQQALSWVGWLFADLLGEGPSGTLVSFTYSMLAISRGTLGTPSMHTGTCQRYRRCPRGLCGSCSLVPLLPVYDMRTLLGSYVTQPIASTPSYQNISA